MTAKLYRFWGVFTIDASSQDTAQQSFVTIAKLCGVDPNERAAKSWLSSCDRPWLLLIDNADNIDDSKLERCFPDGGQGLILITTRNPNIKTHGTIGQRFYQFERLEDDEASELLLRAADYQRPHTSLTIQLATTISKALGALPLALVHAGNAIKAKFCSFNDYLSYYDRSWQIIRQNQRVAGGPQNNNGNMEEYMEIYSSYEILYRGLEAMNYQRFKDAIQLLQLFSFLHHENIPFDILVAASEHSRIEREVLNGTTQSQEAEEEDTTSIGDLKLTWVPASWSRYLRTRVFQAFAFLFADRSQTILPTFLRDAELSVASDDNNVRLRKALHELQRLSLITHHETSDSYSMHPLVHTWVRERP